LPKIIVPQSTVAGLCHSERQSREESASSWPLPQPPRAAVPPSGQYPSASTASASTVDASPQSAPDRPHAPGSSRHAHRTSCSSPCSAHRMVPPFSADPPRRGFCAFFQNRPLPLLPRGDPAPSVLFPPLSFLRRRRPLALDQDCLHARDILAQPANLL